MVKGIVDDVLDRRLILIVRLDHLRPVAAAEDVILPSVPLVEGTGVAAVQIPHPLVEVRQRGLDEQVVVVPHQAIGPNEPLVADTGLCEQRQEVRVLASVCVEILATDTAIHQVVDGAGELNAWRARHGINL